jgi:hypothetical protein
MSDVNKEEHLPYIDPNGPSNKLVMERNMR